MRQRLYHRLKVLEVENARLRIVQRARDDKAQLAEARRTVETFLRICGVERSETESLFEAWARALGIWSKELRAQLAAGIDPIKKYFRDNDIYEEIERRKAAGEWPAAPEGMQADVRL